MKLLSKLACVAGLAMTTLGAAHAATVVNNWYFNPNGAGLGSATLINESLDVVGSAFIQLTGTPPPGTFSFTENGVFVIPTHDGGTSFPLGSNQITATLSAFGTGNFSGNFTFGGGTIEVWANSTNAFGSTGTNVQYYGANTGTKIGTFNVTPGGGGLVDGSGSPVGNGQITLLSNAVAGSLLPGYWFDPLGADLNTLGTLAFAFTNANTIGSPTATLVDEVACQFAGFGGAGCPGGTGYANVAGSHFFVGDNGQFKLAVPEPGSLALVGLALVAAGALRGRNNAKHA